MGLKRLSLMAALAALCSLAIVSSAPAGNFDEPRMGCSGEDPAICPVATTGTAYSLPIELGGDEDEQCAVFSSAGGLPPGLSITRSVVNETGFGLISGIPTQAGTFTFYLTVTYNRETACPFKNPSDDRFTITVVEGLAKLTIGPESAPNGTVSSPYSLQMTATVADPKTWTIEPGTTLPPGLAIDAASGLISGTPTSSGTFVFTVRARMNGDSRTDTKTLGIVVRDPLTISASEPFSIARRARGEVGLPFGAMVTATGGDGTYTWSVATGTLPPGIELADGALAGTPTTAGVYPFVLSAADAEGRIANYAARIVVAEKVSVATRILRKGKVGKLYTSKLSIRGGFKPATWRIFRGPLPRGIRFDRSGTLFGVPKVAGRYRVTFEATDLLGATARKTLRIDIAPKPKPKPKTK